MLWQWGPRQCEATSVQRNCCFNCCAEQSRNCHFIQTQLTDDVVVSGMDFLGQWDEFLLSVDMAKDEDRAKNHQHRQHGPQHADLRPVVLCILWKQTLIVCVTVQLL